MMDRNIFTIAANRFTGKVISEDDLELLFENYLICYSAPVTELNESHMQMLKILKTDFNIKIEDETNYE